MDYRVEKASKGKRVVAYACPRCHEALRSPLEDAGNKDKCPVCQNELVVPGEAELVAWHREQEEQRHRAERERLAEVQREAAAKLAADIQAQAKEREKADERARALAARERQRQALGKSPASDAADRFLGWAFSFGKLISIVVIAACFCVITYSVLNLVTVAEKAPVTVVPVMTVPTAAAYRQAMQPVAANQVGTADNSLTSSATETPIEKKITSLSRLFGIGEDHIWRAMREFDYGVWDEFLTGLEKFGAELKVQKQTTNLAAAQWYIREFGDKESEVTKAQKQRDEEQAMARFEAATRRSYFTTLLAGAVGALLTFLFLPLLIQIEQNTRKLLEHGTSGAEVATPINLSRNVPSEAVTA
jgi:hypothetical protein